MSVFGLTKYMVSFCTTLLQYNTHFSQHPFCTTPLFTTPILLTWEVKQGFFLQCGVIKIVFFVAVGPVLKWLLPFQSGLLLSFAANSHSILCILRHILANKISVIKTSVLLVPLLTVETQLSFYQTKKKFKASIKKLLDNTFFSFDYIHIISFFLHVCIPVLKCMLF